MQGQNTVFGLLTELWEQVEALAGIAAAFFIGYLPPVALIFLMFATLGQRQWGWSVLAGAGLTFSLVAAIWVTRLIGEALYDRYPQFRPVKSSKESVGLDRSSMDTTALDHVSADEQTLREMIEELEVQVSSINETLDGFVSAQVRPVALLAADRLTDVPVFLRPFLSLWWLDTADTAELVTWPP